MVEQLDTRVKIKWNFEQKKCGKMCIHVIESQIELIQYYFIEYNLL